MVQTENILRKALKSEGYSVFCSGLNGLNNKNPTMASRLIRKVPTFRSNNLSALDNMEIFFFREFFSQITFRTSKHATSFLTFCKFDYLQPISFHFDIFYLTIYANALFSLVSILHKIYPKDSVQAKYCTRYGRIFFLLGNLWYILGSD